MGRTGKHHTPEQIVRKLQAADRLATDSRTADGISRELGVSTASYCKWRKRYGQMALVCRNVSLASH